VSSLIVAAGERCGLLGVGFENMMRSWVTNEGTSRDWAWRRLDGWGSGRPRSKEGEWGEGLSLAITAMFCIEFAFVFRLSVSIRKVASEHPFCVLIYMVSRLFHFIYFLVKHMFNI